MSGFKLTVFSYAVVIMFTVRLVLLVDSTADRGFAHEISTFSCEN